MDEHNQLFTIKGPIKFESVGESLQPLMRKIGRGRVSLLAWKTRQAAESYMKQLGGTQEGAYKVFLESAEYIENLRKDFKEMGYEFQLEIKD